MIKSVEGQSEGVNKNKNKTLYIVEAAEQLIHYFPLV